MFLSCASGNRGYFGGALKAGLIIHRIMEREDLVSWTDSTSVEFVLVPEALCMLIADDFGLDYDTFDGKRRCQSILKESDDFGLLLNNDEESF